MEILRKWRMYRLNTSHNNHYATLLQAWAEFFEGTSDL